MSISAAREAREEEMGRMSWIDRIAGRAPDPEPVALSFVRSGNVEHWTYRTLVAAAGGIAARVNPIATSDPIVLHMAPTGESVAALIGLLRQGRHVVLIPASLPRGETDAVVEAVGAEWLLSTSPPRANGTREQFPAGSGLALARVRDRSADIYVAYPGAAIIQMTSGSFGASKLARRSLASVESECADITSRLAAALPAEHRASVLCASSISHSYGCIGGLLAPLGQGAHVLLAPSPTDVDVFAGLEASVLVGLAATYEALLTSREPMVSTRPQLAFSAGAPLPAGLYEATLETLGIAIRQDYGTTETGTISLDDALDPDPDTVGTPLERVEIAIRAEGDEALGAGVEGEVLVRTPAVADAYLIGGHPVRLPVRNGWYHTGDVGRLDERGRLRLAGRVRSLVRLRGRTVKPDEIEGELFKLKGVVEAVVVPSAEGDTAGFRAVVVAPGVDGETIRVWLDERLGNQAEPRIVDVVDALPRSPAGKILQKYFPVGDERSAYDE